MEKMKLVAKVLADARAEIKSILTGEDDMVILPMDSGLERLVNRALFLGGIYADPAAAKVEFPPIVIEGVAVTKPVTEEDLEPEDEAKGKFLKKVDELEKQFPALESEKILESYVVKEDIMAIRGVAKRAQLEDFRTAEINLEFLERIRQGLINVAAAAAFVEVQNENINK